MAYMNLTLSFARRQCLAARCDIVLLLQRLFDDINNVCAWRTSDALRFWALFFA